MWSGSSPGRPKRLEPAPPVRCHDQSATTLVAGQALGHPPCSLYPLAYRPSSRPPGYERRKFPSVPLPFTLDNPVYQEYRGAYKASSLFTGWSASGAVSRLVETLTKQFKGSRGVRLNGSMCVCSRRRCVGLTVRQQARRWPAHGGRGGPPCARALFHPPLDLGAGGAGTLLVELAAGRAAHPDRADRDAVGQDGDPPTA